MRALDDEGHSAHVPAHDIWLQQRSLRKQKTARVTRVLDRIHQLSRTSPGLGASHAADLEKLRTPGFEPAECSLGQTSQTALSRQIAFRVDLNS